ncbi:ester cyclase [Smaragdicoccus niigatensis]|uniref:ester cyclase n=1 Tax=Smaragdicoccus niigatensis TaxID=359359 RepID=UPI000377CE74|nr:ester cyclase [Smaragdicoccus niigatensis]
MSDQNKATARRIFEAWNARDLDAFDEVFAATAITHDPQNPFQDVVGPEGMRMLVRMYTEGFSDQSFLINEQIAEGDFVVTRWTGTGHNDGPMMGMPATNKSCTVTGMTINRFENGKIVEGWASWDTLGMLQQLGVIPAPQAAGA